MSWQDGRSHGLEVSRSYGRGIRLSCGQDLAPSGEGDAEERDKKVVASWCCSEEGERLREKPVAGPWLQNDQSALDEWGLPFPRRKIVSNPAPFYDRTYVLVKSENDSRLAG